jgi:hypothetical protein
MTRDHTRRRGQTLAEVLISTAVVSVIMGGMSSVMMLSARTLTNNTVEVCVSGDAGDQVTTDLKLAQEFSERTATAVTMKVPDRDGDSQPETIRYSWSGVSGAPLMREYNGGDPVAVAADVSHFDLSYQTKTVAAGSGGGGGGGGDPDPPAEQETSEMLLISHNNTSGGSLKDHKIEKNKWCGTYFHPTLPSNAVKWKITRVMIQAKRDGGANGSFAVQVRDADSAQKPTTTVLGQSVIYESSLSNSYQWKTLTLSGLDDLDPGDTHCIVIKHNSGSGRVAKIRYEKNSADTAGAHFLITNNKGGSWTSYSGSRDMQFYVYGTVTTTGAPQW